MLDVKAEICCQSIKRSSARKLTSHVVVDPA